MSIPSILAVHSKVHSMKVRAQAFSLTTMNSRRPCGAATDHMCWAFGTPANYYDGKLKPDFAKGFPAWDVGPLTFAKIAGARFGR